MPRPALLVDASHYRFSALWRCPKELWEQVSRKGIIVGPRTRDEDNFVFNESDATVCFVGPVLHANGLHTIQVVDDPEKPELRVEFRSERRPKADPPEWLHARDEKVGGTAGFRVLALALASDPAPVVSYNARATLSRGWQCSVVPRTVESSSPEAAALELGQATLEEVGFRFTSGALGIQEVTIVYLHKAGRYSVEVSSTGVLRVGEDLELQAVDEGLELVASRFFRRRDAADV